MELLTGQFGFGRWWLVLFPNTIIQGGKNISAIVGDTFAVKEMAQHLGESIFQDPTWQGRIIGFVIRLGRIGIGLFAQSLVLLGTGLALLLWYIFPLLAVWEIVK